MTLVQQKTSYVFGAWDRGTADAHRHCFLRCQLAKYTYPFERPLSVPYTLIAAVTRRIRLTVKFLYLKARNIWQTMEETFGRGTSF